jgi:hypothetical protein
MSYSVIAKRSELSAVPADDGVLTAEKADRFEKRVRLQMFEETLLRDLRELSRSLLCPDCHETPSIEVDRDIRARCWEIDVTCRCPEKGWSGWISYAFAEQQDYDAAIRRMLDQGLREYVRG